MVRCRRDEVAEHLQAADLAVPFMARLDAATLARAHRLKLILQYGVGLEGVDVAAVCTCPYGLQGVVTVRGSPLP